MCSVFPPYLCVTGCNTTSYPDNIGKVRLFQNLKQKQAFHLVKNLVSHINSYKDVEHTKMFYQTIMSSGFPREIITETQVSIYQKQKIKAS